MNDHYTFNDLYQGGSGSVAAVAVFLGIRAFDPFYVPTWAGFFLTLIIVGGLYKYFRAKVSDERFIYDVGIAVAVTVIIGWLFGLISPEEVTAVVPLFGNGAFLVAVWIAAPVSIVFDLMNLESIGGRTLVQRH